VLGQYPDESVALRIYGVVMIAVSLLSLALYGYVIRHPGLLWAGEVSGRLWIGYLLIVSPIVVYAIAMADASTSVSVVLFLSVPVLYFLLVTILRVQHETRAQTDDFF